MSNELERDRAMVMNLESFGVDGVGYDHYETVTVALCQPSEVLVQAQLQVSS
jgi:hypothetical protein